MKTELLSTNIRYGLIWLSILIGIMGLGVGRKLSNEPMYRWFGAASLVNVVASMNNFVVLPNIERELSAWIVITARMWVAALWILTYLTIFKKIRPWMIRSAIVYMTLGSVLLWAFGPSQSSISMLTLPHILLALIKLAYSLKWLRESRDGLQMAAFLLLTIMISAGVQDWLSKSGHPQFGDQQISPYTRTTILLALGTLMVRDLAIGLIRSQEAHPTRGCASSVGSAQKLMSPSGNPCLNVL